MMNFPVIRDYRRWFRATLGVMVIAWGVAFLRYLGATYVEFPLWPNILDVIGLMAVGSYLIWREAKLRPLTATSVLQLVMDDIERE